MPNLPAPVSPSTPVAEPAKRVFAVLLCGGCGKLFRYDQPYTLDPGKRASDGSLAPFGKGCYKPDAEVVATPVPDALVFAFETKGLRVYTVTGEIPVDFKHEKKS